MPSRATAGRTCHARHRRDPAAALARACLLLVAVIAAGCGNETSLVLSVPATPTQAPPATVTPPAATATRTVAAATATTAPRGTATQTPRASATRTPRRTPTVPPSPTARLVPSATPTRAPSATATASASPTAAATIAFTAIDTATPSPTATDTAPLPPASPTFTPTPTALPSVTPTGSGAAVCGNRVLEAGESCADCPADCVVGPCAAPGAPTQAFVFDLVAPLGFEPTTATVLIGYDSTVLSLPGTGAVPTVRQRVIAPPPVPQAFTPNDLDHAVRVLLSRNIPLARLFTITFDRCAGAPPPTTAALSCIVESCAAGGTGVPGCRCTVSP